MTSSDEIIVDPILTNITTSGIVIPGIFCPVGNTCMPSYTYLSYSGLSLVPNILCSLVILAQHLMCPYFQENAHETSVRISFSVMNMQKSHLKPFIYYVKSVHDSRNMITSIARRARPPIQWACAGHFLCEFRT